MEMKSFEDGVRCNHWLLYLLTVGCRMSAQNLFWIPNSSYSNHRPISFFTSDHSFRVHNILLSWSTPSPSSCQILKDVRSRFELSTRLRFTRVTQQRGSTEQIEPSLLFPKSYRDSHKSKKDDDVFHADTSLRFILALRGLIYLPHSLFLSMCSKYEDVVWGHVVLLHSVKYSAIWSCRVLSGFRWVSLTTTARRAWIGGIDLSCLRCTSIPSVDQLKNTKR